MRPLQEALVSIFWYKADLRSFLNVALGEPQLLNRLDWTQYKRSIVGDLVRQLFENQHRYGEELITLLLAASEVEDPRWLLKETDGQSQYDRALEAVAVLTKSVAPFAKARTDADAALERQRQSKAKDEARRSMAQGLEELRAEFNSLRTLDPQSRGYALEGLLVRLFRLYDIDTKSSFKIHGEQLDGAFTYEGTEFLLEAKWRSALTPLSDLEAFAGKVVRKLDNTLGLFISINGFQPTAIELAQRSRPLYVLMDGGDLSAVMEGRIPLPELIEKKKRHASRTGEIFVSAWQLVGND